MAEIWIYEPIGAGLFLEGVTASRVRDELSEMDDEEELTVRINSPGGDVFEAQAIRAMLSRRKGAVNVQIDGVAASAASWLATVGTKVQIADGAMLMIHNPWTAAVGDKNEMIETAKLLDKVGSQIAESYAARSGMPLQNVAKAMDAETWYTAKEAVDVGLADSIVEVRAKAWAIPKEFGYRHVPGTNGTQKTSRGHMSATVRRMQLDLIQSCQYIDR